MSFAEKALAALEAAGKAAVPKPGKWRWSARPGSHTIDFGTHGWEAMTFARWGMNGAQPVFLTKCDGTHLLEPASKFLVPVPGEEHHKWAKRVVHPVAQLIENAVNLSAPLAAVARAAMAYRAIEVAWCKQMDYLPKNGGDDAFQEALASAHHEHLIEMSEARSALFAALDALEAAAEGVL